MKAQLHEEAEEELKAAAEWYEQRRPGLSASFLAEVRAAVEVIEEKPDRWPAWTGVESELPVRRYVLRRFPFALAYLVVGDRLVILAVAHVRRRPRYWQRRTQ